MKRMRFLVLLIAIVSVALTGCSRQSDPVIPDYPDASRPSGPMASIGAEAIEAPTVTTSAMINGYLLQFNGRSYAGDRTTFSYTVSGAGSIHALSNFFLELPACAPPLDSFSPTGAVIGDNPLVGIYGIKWNESLGINESRSYSIIFPGDVPLGAIRASVKASTLAAIGEIAGPCSGFEVSGAVYIDANQDGARSPGESGIVDVTVTLVNGDGNVQMATTDASGGYSFMKIAGTYTVRIDAATAADDFNETLAASFDPTGPMSRTVTVGPDSPGNDFGFDPRAAEITLDLEQGILLTTGEPVKFWQRQLRAAMSGGRAEFDAATMTLFIAEIQGLFLPDPFQFTPGSEFREAMSILSTKSKDPLLQLRKELLAAELNEVSGKGLVDAPELQSALLAWAESVVIAASSPASPTILNNPTRTLLGGAIDGRVVDAYNLLVNINGAIGGGSGGGG